MEEEEELESDPETRLLKSVPLLKPTGQLKSKGYSLLKGRLAHFQDNGKWEEFDNFVKVMFPRFSNRKKDIQCVLLIENGVKDYYRNNLEDAHQYFVNAIELASMTDHTDLLQGRIYTLLANLYRQEKKLGLAEKCLELSKKHLHMVEGDEEKAELYYTNGNYLVELLNIASKPSREIVLEAKRCYEKELQIASQCPDERVRVKKMRYAFLKIALLLLDCRNEAGRHREVILDDVLEAKSCLDTIEMELWDSIPFGTRIQFYLARSDQFYRLESFSRALDYANLALTTIQGLGFNTQKKQAQERVTLLEQLKMTDRIIEIPNNDFIPRILDMTDESQGHSSRVDTNDSHDGPSLDVRSPNYDL